MLASGAISLCYDEFCANKQGWPEDYALFRALKNKFGDSHDLEWPEDLMQRKPAALTKARRAILPMKLIASASNNFCC